MPVDQVFCLEEFDWDSDGNRRGAVSVRPLLQLVKSINPGMDFRYRRVKTPAALSNQLQAREQRFNTVYLAFHGTHGQLEVGGELVDLTSLSKSVGACPGGVIHLSSCRTLGMRRGEFPTEDANALVKATGARILSSYTKAVDWDESAAFELILLSCLSSYSTVGSALRHITTKHAGLIERLGWVYYTRDGGPHGGPHVSRSRAKAVRST